MASALRRRKGGKAIAVAVLLAAACAAPAEQRPKVAPPPIASPPDQQELDRLETAFRAKDRELGDLLTQVPSSGCQQFFSLYDELGRLTAKMCKLSSSRDAHGYPAGLPCRYGIARLNGLQKQGRELGCVRYHRYGG